MTYSGELNCYSSIKGKFNLVFKLCMPNGYIKGCWTVLQLQLSFELLLKLARCFGNIFNLENHYHTNQMFSLTQGYCQWGKSSENHVANQAWYLAFNSYPCLGS